MATITLSERKRAAAAAKARAADLLRERLRAYARDRNGRFVLFGSAARRCVRHDSDIDLLLDFQEADQPDAWRFVEAQCRELGLRPDLMPLAWCEPDFLDHVLPDAEIIS